MKTYTIYSAKNHLSSLIEQVCAGEEIVIARGKAAITDAFFEPLSEGELQAWEQ
jgi:hypothetical protein